MADESCGTCRFFATAPLALIGQCRRYPPGPQVTKVHPNADPLQEHGFPAQSAESWCGEYWSVDEPREPQGVPVRVEPRSPDAVLADQGRGEKNLNMADVPDAVWRGKPIGLGERHMFVEMPDAPATGGSGESGRLGPMIPPDA
jgi:hypothetical protein